MVHRGETIQNRSTWRRAKPTSPLASAFADEAPPFVVMLDADASSKPHLMNRATEIVLSRSEREAAMARSALREMRRRVIGAVAAPDPMAVTREMRDRRSCVLIVDPQSLGIERSIRRPIDADVRVVSRASRAFLDIAVAEVSSGEVDLVLSGVT